MPSKKPVNLASLEALGARRLAAILLELSAEAGAEAVAADIGKRLVALRQGRSFIDWQKRRAFVRELDLQRQLVTDRLVARPDLALELMWRFIGLGEPGLNPRGGRPGDVGGRLRQARPGL